MKHSIQNRLGAVFVPVRDIESAREWYCNLLQLPVEGEISFGHIYCVPLQDGTNLVLDSKMYDPDSVRTAPLFHFNTENIQAAYQFIQEQQIELVTGIEHGHWFTFKDPDGNVLMVCKC